MYTPRRGLSNGHVMTIYAWGRPRTFPRLPAPEERFFDVAPDTRVLAHCHWQADRARHPALLVLHGLEGSSQAHYMRGLADKGYAAGFNVVLLNQRNCGGTERLSAGLYHSGLTADADHVIREMAAVDHVQQVVVAGYSLGGNLALKLAGDYGDAPPPQLRGVCAVSPVMELEACVRALERRQNFFYQWNFVRGLKGRMRRKAQWFPGPLRPRSPRRHPQRARVRRGLHGAALRLRERVGLLPPRERDAGDRSRARAGPDHHRRGRSFRADGAVPRCDAWLGTRGSTSPSPGTAATARS